MSQIMQQLLGLSRDHLVQLSEGIWLHPGTCQAFEKLRAAAAGEGIALAVASGYRDFQRQLKIWNDKAGGQRVVFSRDGQTELDVRELSDTGLMHAILRWSALPGASRHHWGTDMDVWDSAAVKADYQLQLTPDEFAENGPFARLNRWLQSGVLEDAGFYRPYSEDRGGVSPEPWHISYSPLAEGFGREFDYNRLRQVIERADIRLKPEILDNFDDIRRRYIQC